MIASPVFDRPALKTTRTAHPNILLEAPLILREKGSGTRQVLEQRLQSQGVIPSELTVFLELGSTEAVKGAVVENLGVSFLSAAAIEKELQLNILRAYSLSGLSLKSTLLHGHIERTFFLGQLRVHPRDHALIRLLGVWR